MDASSLPPGQQRFFLAVLAHFVEYGESPTYRQLMSALGITSTHGIKVHIDALSRKGFLEQPARGSKEIYPANLRSLFREVAAKYADMVGVETTTR